MEGNQGSFWLHGISIIDSGNFSIPVGILFAFTNDYFSQF